MIFSRSGPWTLLFIRPFPKDGATNHIFVYYYFVEDKMSKEMKKQMKGHGFKYNSDFQKDYWNFKVSDEKYRKDDDEIHFGFTQLSGKPREYCLILSKALFSK